VNKAVLSQVIRSFLPELAIGSACCAAGYFFLVDPMVGKLAQAHAEVDALTMAVTKGAGQAPAVADDPKARFAAKAIDTIAARSALAADQAHLLQAVSTLADTCRVRIEQFNPAQPHGPRTVPGQSAVKADPKIEQRTALSISLTGTYADTARFIRTMQQEIGFTMIRAMRVAPTGASTPDIVSVTLDTEHVAVNPKALAAAQAAPTGHTPGQPGQQATVPTQEHH
jgi:Tfp pilus assembly protein PilO